MTLRILIVHEIDWIRKVIFEPHHLAELFSNLGHNVFVIDCREPDVRSFFDGLRMKIVPNFHRVYDNASITLVRPPALLIKGMNRITHFLTCKNTLKKIAKENRIDIILLYGAATNGIQTIEIAKELHIPVIFRVLDVAHGLVSNSILRNRAKKYEKLVLKNSDFILATTPNLSSYAIEMGASKEKVNTFSLGINAKIFKPVERNHDLEQKLGISKDDFVILFIGTIFEFSGLDKIISEFDILLKKSHNTKLLIVGGGSALPYLQSLAQKKKLLTNVIFTGFKQQNEIPSFIALANICINSFQINSVTNRILPTKILEYLACGKPVLSTPLKGTIELLPDEKFGILYSNSEKFVEKISELMDDLNYLEKLGKLGYKYVQDNHNWEVLSKNLTTIFDQVIKNKIKTGSK